jgi:hypothetical protein
MKNIIQTAEANSKRQWGYLVRCDDPKRTEDIDTDKYFHLWEWDLLSEYIKSCEIQCLSYDLVIQDFDAQTDTWDEINIINNNYKNQ